MGRQTEAGLSLFHRHLFRLSKAPLSPVKKKQSVRRPPRFFKDIGMMFPVRRLARKLKNASQLRVGLAPAIFLAAVLQYLITEIFDLTVSKPQLIDSHINCNIETEQIRRFMT